MNYFTMLKAALSHIENNLCEPISADAVARQVNFSPSHFHAVFRTAIGVPPAAYIRARRLMRAAQELACGGKRVVDIALRYGFDSHETFTRAFQRQFGCTPTAFRASHSTFEVPLVVPGIHGPLYIGKEDFDMCSSLKTGMERLSRGLVLHGVPKVSYFGNPPELTPYPACVANALKYAGVDIPYAHYHCMGGTAFRLMWNMDYWDGGNVDVLAMAGDTAEPLRRAAAAGGRGIELILKEGVPSMKSFAGHLHTGADVRTGSREDMLALIHASLEQGIPAIGFGIIGPPEACLITGYDEDGDVLMGWNFFQDMPELAGSVERTDEGYFLRRGWFEHDDTLGVLALSPKASDCTAEEQRRAVAGALRRAAAILRPRQVWARAGGLSAFDAWAADLGKASEFPTDAPLPMLFERLMCESDAHTMVAEGRSYAEGWLKHMAGQYSQAAEPMLKAAELFEQSHRVCWEMWDLIGGLQMGEEQARRLGDANVRAQLIQRIAVLKGCDERAIPLLEQASELLV